MLYKLAADKAKLDRDAKTRMDYGGVANAIVEIPVGARISGYITGKEAGHPVVGLIGGPSAVNGAIAKETGHSTFGTTTGRGMRNGAIIGGLAGAIKGARAGGIRGAAVRGAIGTLGGGLAGGLFSGMGYGLGRSFSKERPKRTTRIERK